MLNKTVYNLFILVFIFGCNEKDLNDFNPLSDGCDNPNNIIQDFYRKDC